MRQFRVDWEEGREDRPERPGMVTPLAPWMEVMRP